MRGWVDNQLDEFVREREMDPFSLNLQGPATDAMLPADFGLTSLVYETFFSQSLAWWAKAQCTYQQKDKYLERKMYGSPPWYDHFMDRRNNLGSHFPNNERYKVPGDRWLIARGYYPFGDIVLTAFKYILSESMALLVPPQNRETTLCMCLGAFGVDQADISDLEVPDPSNSKSFSLIVKEPTPLLYQIIPLPNGNWVCEAWDVDSSGNIIEDGKHYNLPAELACSSPRDAFKALSEQVNKERKQHSP